MKRLIGVLVITAAAVVPCRGSDCRGAVERAQARRRRRPNGRPTATIPAACAFRRSRRSRRPMSASCRWRGSITCSRRRGRRRPPPAQATRRAGARDADGDAAARASPPSETTPLVVNGVMYITTPYGRVVALDPTTGKEVWVFQLPAGNPSTRGVEYWPGDAQTPPQIVFGTERRPGSTRSTRRPASPTRPSATRASST